MKQTLIYLFICVVVSVCVCSNARAERVCSEEYQSWCRVNHPLCDIYKDMCDPVQDVFLKFKYKEKAPISLSSIEDTEDLIIAKKCRLSNPLNKN